MDDKLLHVSEAELMIHLTALKNATEYINLDLKKCTHEMSISFLKTGLETMEHHINIIEEILKG